MGDQRKCGALQRRAAERPLSTRDDDAALPGLAYLRGPPNRGPPFLSISSGELSRLYGF